MMQRRIGHEIAPTPEELAAFVDGELDSLARARVQAWLARHPEAAVELRGQTQLADLCRATTPPEPDAATWDLLQRRIERDVTLAQVCRPAGNRRLRVLLPLLATAASLLFAVLWLQPGAQEVHHDHEDILAVAGHHDVEIISLEEADHYALVIGKSPLAEPMILVAPGDARDIRIEPDVDGMIPTVARVPDGLATVMVVAPLGWTGEDKE